MESHIICLCSIHVFLLNYVVYVYVNININNLCEIMFLLNIKLQLYESWIEVRSSLTNSL